MGRFEQIPRTRINKACYFIFILIFVYMGTASARRQSRGCSVERCHKPYSRAMHRLKTGDDNVVAECKAYLKYQRCLSRIRRFCRGHLLFHSIEHMNQKNLKRCNCTSVVAEHKRLQAMSPPTEVIGTATPNTSVTTLTTHTVRENSACTYKGRSALKQCELLEGSKIQSYVGDLRSCYLEGTWSLLDNDYLAVTVTFVKDENDLKKSYASKISVLIRSAGDCAQKKVYLATTTDNANLPSAFTDGSTTSGSVRVVEIIPNQHVEIQAGFINATVTLRSRNRRLTVGAQIPDEFTKSLRTRNQLCGDEHPLQPAAKSSSSDSHDSNTGSESRKTFSEKGYIKESLARRKCRNVMCNGPRKFSKKSNFRLENENAPKATIKVAKNTKSNFAQLILSKQTSEPFLIPKKRQKRAKKRKHRRCSQFKHEKNFKSCFDSCVSGLVNTGRLNLTLIKNWLNDNSLPFDNAALEDKYDVIHPISSDCSDTVSQSANRTNGGVRLTSSSIFAPFFYLIFSIVFLLF